MARRSGGRRPATGHGKRKAPAEQLTGAQRSWILGLFVLSLALLTSLSLLSSQHGSLTLLWLKGLRQVFGWGIYVVPIALAILGVWMITLGTDQPLALPGVRMAGGAVLLLAALTMSHLFVEQPEQVAWDGRGGGYVGYWLSNELAGALGRPGAIVILVVLAGIGLMMSLQISLTEVAGALAGALYRVAAWVRGLSSAWPRRRPFGPEIGQRQLPLLQQLAVRSPSPPVDHFDPRLAQLAQGAGSVSVPAVRLSPPMAGEAMGWVLPRVEDILAESKETQMSLSDIREKARIIEETLGSLGVPAAVVEVNPGPVVTQFGLEPGYLERHSRRDGDGETKRVKVKVSRIAAVANDLALALAASSIRIEAPVPGKGIVGLEIPNSESAVVGLRGVMQSEQFQALSSRLVLAMGRDVSGSAVAEDLSKLPHILIAGATGSGKSVCINAFVAALLFRNTPDDLKMLMIDPKRVELSNFNGIPHLLAPVVVELDRVVGVLNWVTREMDRRYKLFARAGARNLQAYNELAVVRGESKQPLIVVFIDELADLMMVAPDDVERSICRIAQMARATGIHLVVATQRPSVDVVTGLIKANFPARLSFAVSSQIDSRVILDTPGAEKLLGRGDALYMAPDSPKLMRIQGCWVSDVELGQLVAFWQAQASAQVGVPTSASAATPPGSLVQQPLPGMPSLMIEENDQDPLWDDAVKLVSAEGKASVSFLQRRLRIGYTRAARLVDLLEAKGVVGPATGNSSTRDVFKPADSARAANDGGDATKA